MFAIQTSKGYFATQGNTCWFQEEPNGWALYTTEEYAREIGEYNHSMIGTCTGEGYTLEEIEQ